MGPGQGEATSQQPIRWRSQAALGGFVQPTWAGAGGLAFFCLLIGFWFFYQGFQVFMKLFRFFFCNFLF